MSPFVKLARANKDYHEAVDEIFCDDETISNVEKRAAVKSEFGGVVDTVFNMMVQANALIAPYYEELK